MPHSCRRHTIPSPTPICRLLACVYKCVFGRGARIASRKPWDQCNAASATTIPLIFVSTIPKGQLMALTILVADDEPDLLELIEYNISNLGHSVITATDGVIALKAASERVPDLVVLDVMMPRLTGIEVAKRMRAQTETANIPIIMLTAKAEEAHELEGLGAGADDYITKPFSMQILLARIDALVRRTQGPASDSAQIELGPVLIDLSKHQALVDGNPISLTITEFRLLACLLSEPGQVLTRKALISAAIGPDVTVTARTIDVHITAIRRKLGDYASMITTVRSVGYRADAPSTANT